MALQTEMTYVALRPLRVGGQTRHKGELVPEARTWHNLEAYIRGGRVAAVPRASVDQEALAKAEEAWEALKNPEPEEEAQDESTSEESNENTDESETDQDDGGADEEEPQDDEDPAEDDESEDEPESEHDLEQYHTGNGWYEVPGADKKMRREEALEFLTAPEDDQSEE
jgi:hypothetical protein